MVSLGKTSKENVFCSSQPSIVHWLMSNPIFPCSVVCSFVLGHSGDFGNAAKMVGKMSKSVMQLISIGF